MTSGNELILAVAGSGKTQSIVDECAAAPAGTRILIVTYTQANQDELRRRLGTDLGPHPTVEVLGWFSFLISHFVRPFLPYIFYGKRVHGFDFDSPYQQGVSVGRYSRYFNGSDQVRKVHLAHLAHQLVAASGDAPITRLTKLYDRIYIDEVQDLCGWDLEVLDLLLQSPIPIEMVGDVRQAILATSNEERKNSQYKLMQIWEWFKLKAAQSRLVITQRPETWRCHAEIASFADDLFDASWGFQRSISKNSTHTDHDGIYFVRESDVPAYLDAFAPLLLRDTANTARSQPYLFTNIGVSKGLSSVHVLIWPTAAQLGYATSGSALTTGQSAKLYVAVTRAEQSVAFVVPDNIGATRGIWTATSQ